MFSSPRLIQLRTDERKREALEIQYTIAHTSYIEAAQELVDDAAKGDGDDADSGGDDTAEDGGEFESVERRKEQAGEGYGDEYDER